MLYYQRKCETKITILLNFYRELNLNFSLSLKIYIDSLTFLNAINFYFKVFYKKYKRFGKFQCILVFYSK